MPPCGVSALTVKADTAIFYCDAAAGRPGEREHFSCLGMKGSSSFGTNPLLV